MRCLEDLGLSPSWKTFGKRGEESFGGERELKFPRVEWNDLKAGLVSTIVVRNYSVLVKILLDGPCDRASIPREVRFIFLKNLKLEVRSKQKNWQRVDLWSETEVP